MLPGDALSKVGNTLNVNVDGTTITINGSNQLQLSSGAAGSALSGGNGAALDVQVDGTTIDIASNALRIAAGAAGAGLTGGGGSALAVGQGSGIVVSANDVAADFGVTADVSPVGTADDGGSLAQLARIDHVHAAPFPALGNKAMAASATSGNYQSSGCSMAAAPALGCYVGVRVNGIYYEVGNGVKTSDCYFSGNGGTSARAFGAVQNGDTLYWNGVIAGFDLSGSDVVDFDYIAFA